MRSKAVNIGLLFLAVMSVYSGSVKLTSSVAFADVSIGDGAIATQRASDPFGEASEPTVVDAPPSGKSLTTDDVNYNADVGTVEIHVNDAPLVEVLRMLSLQSRKNIIASKDVRGTITANLYGVTVPEALDAILNANGYAYRAEGNFIYVFTKEELQAQEQAKRVRKTRVFRLSYTPAADVVRVLRQSLGEGAKIEQMAPAQAGVESGTTTGNTYATAELVVVTDFEDKIEEAQRIIGQIDKRPQQVLVEATIVTARLDDSNSLGVDFSVLGGLDFSTLSFSPSSASGPGLTDRIPGSTVAASSAGSDLASRGYVGLSTGGGGLRMGVVKDNIGVFLTALERNTNTVVLANPKVLVSNRHLGRVQVGQRLGYRDQTTISSGGESTVGAVSFLDTGTILSFRPFIGDDGFIRMEVRPEQSDGLIDAETQVPTASTANITTNIVVRDGHTVVIGGLFRDRTERVRNQVPGVGNLPGVGALFRKQDDSVLREEIIVLLTPHIIKDDAVYSEESLKALERFDMMRVGLRRGLMPWGRERLAEGFYDAAVRELAKPNPNSSSALFHLNAATNLNPTFVEANDLKRKVTGKVVTSINSSATHAFVRDLIRVDDALTHEPEPEPEPAPASATTKPVSLAHRSINYDLSCIRPIVAGSTRYFWRISARIGDRVWVVSNDSIAWMNLPALFQDKPRAAVVQIDVR